MASLYIHRVFVIIPAAKQAQVNAWWKANVDPAGGDLTFTAGLSASGSGSVSHYVACGSFTAAQFKLVVQQLCALAAVSFPSTWDAMTAAQQRAWVVSQYTGLRNKSNLKWVTVDNNAGSWSDYELETGAAGLKRIRGLNG